MTRTSPADSIAVPTLWATFGRGQKKTPVLLEGQMSQEERPDVYITLLDGHHVDMQEKTVRWMYTATICMCCGCRERELFCPCKRVEEGAEHYDKTYGTLKSFEAGQDVRHMSRLEVMYYDGHVLSVGMACESDRQSRHFRAIADAIKDKLGLMTCRKSSAGRQRNAGRAVASMPDEVAAIDLDAQADADRHMQELLASEDQARTPSKKRHPRNTKATPSKYATMAKDKRGLTSCKQMYAQDHFEDVVASAPVPDEVSLAKADRQTEEHDHTHALFAPEGQSCKPTQKRCRNQAKVIPCNSSFQEVQDSSDSEKSESNLHSETCAPRPKTTSEDQDSSMSDSIPFTVVRRRTIPKEFRSKPSHGSLSKRLHNNSSASTEEQCTRAEERPIVPTSKSLNLTKSWEYGKKTEEFATTLRSTGEIFGKMPMRSACATKQLSLPPESHDVDVAQSMGMWEAHKAHDKQRYGNESEALVVTSRSAGVVSSNVFTSSETSISNYDDQRGLTGVAEASCVLAAAIMPEAFSTRLQRFAYGACPTEIPPPSPDTEDSVSHGRGMEHDHTNDQNAEALGTNKIPDDFSVAYSACCAEQTGWDSSELNSLLPANLLEDLFGD